MRRPSPPRKRLPGLIVARVVLAILVLAAVVYMLSGY
jgi:hypothetical protein